MIWECSPCFQPLVCFQSHKESHSFSAPQTAVNPFQSKDMRGHSNVPLKVKIDLPYSREHANVFVLTLLDLSAAFDTIDYSILLTPYTLPCLTNGRSRRSCYTSYTSVWILHLWDIVSIFIKRNSSKVLDMSLTYRALLTNGCLLASQTQLRL